MSEWVDTTGLPITDISENSIYKSVHYAKPCADGFGEFFIIDAATRKFAEKNGNKQAIFTFECGCQLISELTNKSLEGKAQK